MILSFQFGGRFEAGVGARDFDSPSATAVGAGRDGEDRGFGFRAAFGLRPELVGTHFSRSDIIGRHSGYFGSSLRRDLPKRLAMTAYFSVRRTRR